MSSNSGRGRTRDWWFFMYPESATPNWESVLDDMHVPWVKSPLHQYDVDQHGELLKPHYHVILYFDSVKDKRQIEEFVKPLGGTLIEKVLHKKSTLRYLCHLDNPEKYQYSVSDIEYHCGADPNDILKPSASERYIIIGEMLQYIRDNNITEFFDFSLYCFEHRPDDWHPVLCDAATRVISEAIRSNRHRGGKKSDEEVQDDG